MNRFRAFSLTALVALFSIPATAAAATNLPLFDANFAIVPEACRACPCGIGGVLQLIQNLMNAAISISVLAVVIMLAYGGALLLTSATNSEAKSKAKTLIANAVIGLVIVLAGWLIVDFVMKALYNPEVGAAANDSFGPWNEILTGGPICITATNQKPLFSHIFDVGKPTQNPGDGANGGGAGGGGSATAGPASGDCSAAALSKDWGSEKIGKTFACILTYESGCRSNALNPTSSAGGRYQVVMGYNDTGHNLNFASCTLAAQKAGYTVSGNLNCSQYFKGGRSDGSAMANACRAAQRDPTCNTDAAKWLFNEAGKVGDPYKPWTQDPDARGQRACVAQYGR